jgi:hypothetical protein
VTVTLPAASSFVGQWCIIQKTGATGIVTINRAGADTIAGQTSWSLDVQYDSLTLMGVSGSGDWAVL